MASFSGTEEPGHGLVGEIRASLDSDQYDLAGYTEQRAHDLIVHAFQLPLTAPKNMIKFTFVVGGGKLVRSRYSEDLTKWLVAALREIGFTEDRSAAETFDSQGTYKQQHDTGQNLKYLIVYPRVLCSEAKGPSSDGQLAVSSNNPLSDPKSPESLILAAESATFQDIMASKASSYAQKKKVLKFLQEKQEEFQAVEAKLVAGQALNPSEQAFYDNNSGQDQEKINWLQNAIKEMVDQGQLTSLEKTDLLKQIDGNIDTTKQEIEATKAENKPKKLEKLEQKLSTLQTRKEHVQKITGVQHKLKHSEQIIAHYLKLFPLQALEEKGRSMSLTLADLKSLEEKMDLEAAIKELEVASREWFVEDSVFEEMCQNEEKAGRAKYKVRQQQQANKSGGGGNKSGTTNKTATKTSSTSWSTVGAKKTSSTNAWGNAGGKAKSSSAFAGLGDDSD